MSDFRHMMIKKITSSYLTENRLIEKRLRKKNEPMVL